MPARVTCRPLGATYNTISGWAHDCFRARTRWKSALLFSRCRLCTEDALSAHPPPELLNDGQPLAPAESPHLEDPASISGAHPLKETVLALPRDPLRLIGAFHAAKKPLARQILNEKIIRFDARNCQSERRPTPSPCEGGRASPSGRGNSLRLSITSEGAILPRARCSTAPGLLIDAPTPATTLPLSASRAPRWAGPQRPPSRTVARTSRPPGGCRGRPQAFVRSLLQGGRVRATRPTKGRRRRAQRCPPIPSGRRCGRHLHRPFRVR